MWRQLKLSKGKKKKSQGRGTFRFVRPFSASLHMGWSFGAMGEVLPIIHHSPSFLYYIFRFLIPSLLSCIINMGQHGKKETISSNFKYLLT